MSHLSVNEIVRSRYGFFQLRKRRFCGASLTVFCEHYGVQGILGQRGMRLSPRYTHSTCLTKVEIYYIFIHIIDDAIVD